MSTTSEPEISVAPTKRKLGCVWITSIGTYVPSATRDNTYYAERTGLSAETIEKLTGINTRRIAAADEDAFALAFAAAKACFDNAGEPEMKPDLIISGSYTPSDLIGTIAHRLQRALNLPNARAIYLSAACSSMLNAIEVAEGYFAVGKSKVCLVTASEPNSLYNDEADPSSGHLCGDGAGAFVLSTEAPRNGRGLRIVTLMTRAHATDGHGPDAIYLRPHNGGLRMPQGKEVFRQAVAKMSAIAREALAEAGLNCHQVRYLVPHQANQRIIDALGEELGLGRNRIASTISEYGNTGSASIVLTFAKIADELKDGEYALLVTFGGGYSSGAMIVRAEAACKAEPISALGLHGCNGNRAPGNGQVDRAETSFIEALVQKGGPELKDYPLLEKWFVSVQESADRGELSSSGLLALRDVFGSAMSSGTLQGLVCERLHGYPGDFEIIDKIYTRHYSPRPNLMRWDGYFQTRGATKAVRNRKQYFHDLLDRHHKRKRPLRVLNLASGPGRCMFEWLSSRLVEDVHFHCVEIDRDAISYASLLNQEFLSQITFEKRNVVKFLPRQCFDLIWAAGLFDYFSDRIFRSVLRRLLPVISPGGELVIGNFTSSEPCRAYMEFGGWKLHTRSAEELVELALSCGVKCECIRIGHETEGVNLFLHIAT
jgi:3-oxoacyl-[acyl-carrier-protein] synthase-3